MYVAQSLLVNFIWINNTYVTNETRIKMQKWQKCQKSNGNTNAKLSEMSESKQEYKRKSNYNLSFKRKSIQ